MWSLRTVWPAAEVLVGAELSWLLGRLLAYVRKRLASGPSNMLGTATP